MAEAEDLKSSQCGFDPHSGHQLYALFQALVLKVSRAFFAHAQFD